jgi:hypothetical protein
VAVSSELGTTAGINKMPQEQLSKQMMSANLHQPPGLNGPCHVSLQRNPDHMTRANDSDRMQVNDNDSHGREQQQHPQKPEVIKKKKS